MQTVQNPPLAPADEGAANGALSEKEFDRAFRPRGAVAFFILLTLLGVLIWFGIYYLMLQRL